MGRRLRLPSWNRGVIIGVVLVIAWGAVAYRLVQVQVVRAAVFADDALSQRLRNVVVPGPRGSIRDRDGNLLALSVQGAAVTANPRQITNLEATAQVLADQLGVNVDELRIKLAEDTGFVYLQRQLEPAQAAPIQALDLPGVYVLPEPIRVYPQSGVASHLLGFVGIDHAGLAGLEYKFDKELTGTPGELEFEVSPRGEQIPTGRFRRTDSQSGKDLVLTIDSQLQYKTEVELAAAVKDSGAKAGSVVILDPTTGGVLALTNYPSFDPNQPGAAGSEQLRNRAVTDTYEPGSTAKLITVSAALAEGKVEPTRLFSVKDQIEVADRKYTDFSAHQEALWDVKRIVGKSSNVGTILIYQELGDPLLFRYLRAFGLGYSTGIDLPAEESGNLDPVSSWCAPCGASTAIGYRVAVTPIQMTAAFAAVANQGVMKQPYVVEQIGNETTGGRRQERVLPDEVAATMRTMLGQVITEGTGGAAAIAGYLVGGKTGTTNKYEPALGKYGEDVIASFIGMAPLSKPAVVIGVFIDSPRAEGFDTGGAVAAPLFSRIASYALGQLGVAPDA